MNKFFIFAALLGVALAADPTTNQQCFDTINKDAAPKCPECAPAKAKDALCTDSANIWCTTISACYDDLAAAAKAAADKAAAAMQIKYNKLCPTDKAKCVDRDGYCPTWAAQKPSQCTSNPDWMLPNCANSCCPVCTGKNTLSAGTCPPADRKDLCVKNTHSSCHAWATQKDSECTKNPKWMNVNCMQSCCDACKTAADKCPTVKDTCADKYATPDAAAGTASCEKWSKNGECTSNPNWMKSNCAKQCCPICQAVAPARPTAVRAVGQVRQPVYQQRQPVYQPYQPQYQPQVRFGGYNTGLPYNYGR